MHVIHDMMATRCDIMIVIFDMFYVTFVMNALLKKRNFICHECDTGMMRSDMVCYDGMFRHGMRCRPIDDVGTCESDMILELSYGYLI